MAQEEKRKTAKTAGAGTGAKAAAKGGSSKAKTPAAKDSAKKPAPKTKSSPKTEKANAAAETKPEPRKRTEYREQIVPRMMERFGYANQMQVPRLVKVVVNMGVGEAVANAKAIDGAVADLETITGQKPSVRRSRLSISNFKLREGMPVGCAVTLRRERMWEFVDRLLSFSIPRIRDFRGLPKRGFDGRGNFTFGLKEQLIFPEIEFDSVGQIRGMNVSFVTTARTDEEAFELLSGMGMPFVRQNRNEG